MKKQLSINNKNVSFTDQGKGETIVLLHGYLESLEIWEAFATQLAKNYRVLCFDIPGHGESETISEQHTMEILAETLSEALQQSDMKKCFMMGHSMGGYVTLMFHKLYPEKLHGLSLFHSHPFADSKETKKKRMREISLVQDGKKDLIAKVNIPNAFADCNLEKFKESVDIATQIALHTPTKGIIANLYAMMNRPDLSESLRKTEKPFLYIAGKKDNYISFKDLASEVKLPVKSEFCVLEQSGHMGFVEERDHSLNVTINFLKNYSD